MVALAMSFVSFYVFSVNEILSKPTYLCAKEMMGHLKILNRLFYLFYFMYMNVLHTYMCVMAHVHACCSCRSEEDIRLPRTRVIDNCKLPVGARD